MNADRNEAPHPLVIVGTGGLGRQIVEIIEEIQGSATGGSSIEILGWLDGNPQTHGTQVYDLPVLGNLDWIKDHPEVGVVVAIAAPATRRKVVEQLYAWGHTRFPVLIHPTALVSRRARLGEGTVICAGVIVNTDPQIGRHVLINALSIIAHDDVLHDYVTTACGVNLSGNVTLGEGVDLGTSVTVNPGVEIGAWSVVGSGAVVTKSLPANCTAVGAPAKPIKERSEGWHF